VLLVVRYQPQQIQANYKTSKSPITKSFSGLRGSVVGVPQHW